MPTTLTPAEAAALTRRRPLHRRPAAERATIVGALEGHLATVVDDIHRNGELEVEFVGSLIGLARTRGGGSDVVVVRTERGELVAIASARVSRIELRA